ncbi:MAG: beta-lactamase family protein [Rhodobacteraceae bacterium]|jgi:CubicO group peptidase (beta-lactamase class C family)|nr:beta-lactamase family protein [Paracoccaceae bacterium]
MTRIRAALPSLAAAVATLVALAVAVAGTPQAAARPTAPAAPPGAVVAAALPPGPAARAESGTPRAQARRMVAAFHDWAQRWGVAHAALVVMSGDRVAGSASRGAYRPGTAVPLASLSKAVTGTCIARLVDEGRIGFDEPLASVMPGFLAAHPPSDARAGAITIGQLLTHSSGITDDVTQGRFPPGLDFRRTNMPAIAAAALASPLGSAPGTAFSYNNVNYVLLGMAVEARTGQGYERACRERVLAPLGILNARLDPGWRILGAYGGWRMPVRDYARFLAHFLPERGLIGTPQADWPRFDLGGGAAYTIGALTRPWGQAANFWHAGAWSWQDDVRSASHSAWFVMMGTRLRYVVADAPRVSDGARGDLDRVMWAAAYPPP